MAYKIANIKYSGRFFNLIFSKAYNHMHDQKMYAFKRFKEIFKAPRFLEFQRNHFKDNKSFQHIFAKHFKLVANDL